MCTKIKHIPEIQSLDLPTEHLKCLFMLLPFCVNHTALITLQLLRKLRWADNFGYISQNDIKTSLKTEYIVLHLFFKCSQSQTCPQYDL